VAVGRAPGLITTEPVGEHGFGFDPVMWLPEFGQTFAQLPPDVKNAHSHRGKSSRQMVALMREHWFG
jgi:XTP/dITP diphosphohydrolase